MRRVVRLWLTAAFLTLASEAAAQPHPASPTSGRQEVSAENQAKAQQHFQHAKELYSSGNYREAIAELEAARTLDPRAKDLVFNLGIVNEKLGRFDEALQLFRDYMAMEGVNAVERARAETVIKRIEGAKRQVQSQTPATTTPSDASSEETTPAPTTPSPPPAERGRIDPLTIGAASVTVVGLGIGTIFGIRAVALRPTGFVTGRDGSYDAFAEQNADAHTSAVIADVGFVIGIASAIATATLYFGRTKTPTTPALSASAIAVPGGGIFSFGGTLR